MPVAGTGDPRLPTARQLWVRLGARTLDLGIQAVPGATHTRPGATDGLPYGPALFSQRAGRAAAATRAGTDGG